MRCGWPQWSSLHCRYESQESVFATHSLLVLLFAFFPSDDHQEAEHGNFQIIFHDESRIIDIEYIEKMSCLTITKMLVFMIRSWEICCGTVRDSEQVCPSHLIVNTCEYVCRSPCTGFSTEDEDEATSQIGMKVGLPSSRKDKKTEDVREFN